MVQSLGDTGVFPSDARKIFDSIGSKDKTIELIPGAHYLEDSVEHRHRAAEMIAEWVRKRV